ncbi:hypothetical protein [Tepidibacter formicigenes]|jgi:hypothetical protein|uniref:Uncharacterized protein n=1 Tax=Tepidibacter formicigenes DSM 15518 TaxID=1123349 RepID=A0A1M6JFD9_9FIRM|nr:hypothetical protein [Tepidibacter formicigenes]SHJ45370.1 hypothetical protein SAMN02744037_00108 [Tepidibacter formicigenes DSM 15518]
MKVGSIDGNVIIDSYNAIVGEIDINIIRDSFGNIVVGVESYFITFIIKFYNKLG